MAQTWKLGHTYTRLGNDERRRKSATTAEEEREPRPLCHARTGGIGKLTRVTMLKL